MNAPHIISPCTRAGSSILHAVHLHLLFAKRFSKAVNTPPFHQIPKRTQLLRPGDITLAPRLLLSVYTVSQKVNFSSQSWVQHKILNWTTYRADLRKLVQSPHVLPEQVQQESQPIYMHRVYKIYRPSLHILMASGQPDFPIVGEKNHSLANINIRCTQFPTVRE